MFDRTHGAKKAAVKNTLNVVAMAMVTAANDVAELVTWITARITAKEYTTYGQAAVVLGFAQKNAAGTGTSGFQNRDIKAIVSYFGEAVPGGDAIIVNSQGAHDIKVANSHRQALETLGYTEFPRVTVKGVLLDSIAKELPQS